MKKYRSNPIVITVVAGQAASLVNFRLPLLKKLLSIGFEVHVCAPKIFDDVSTSGILKENGIILHEVSFERAGINPFKDIKAAYDLYRTFVQIKPEVVLSYTIKPVIFGTVAATLAMVPKRIAMITGLGYAFTRKARGKRYLVRAVVCSLYRTALKKAHHIVFQNPDDLAEFRALGLVKPGARVSIVNGSGVDLDFFKPTIIPPISPRIRFLLIARMLGDKGVREFVAAAKQIEIAYPNVRFELVGDCDDNPDSISFDTLSSWNTAKNITWHGAQSDVRPFLNACHIYVLPSYREGTPRSVLEAMAVGRPIITTDAPGCRETVTPGLNGFLVPPGDAGALKNAMQHFLDHPDLIQEMGKESLSIARLKYDVNIVNEQVLSAIIPL